MSRPFELVFVLDLSFGSVATDFAIFVLSALDFSELKHFNGNLYQLLMKNVDFSNRQVESQLVKSFKVYIFKWRHQMHSRNLWLPTHLDLSPLLGYRPFTSDLQSLLFCTFAYTVIGSRWCSPSLCLPGGLGASCFSPCLFSFSLGGSKTRLVSWC